MRQEKRNLIHEIELKLSINGEHTGRISCTPQDLEELVAGWLFTEGRILHPEQIREIIVHRDSQCADIRLVDEVDAIPFAEGGNKDVPPSDRLKSQSRPRWTPAYLKRLYEFFEVDPPLFAQTHAAHSCMVATHAEDGGVEVLHRSEDAGRHSALDKAIGWAILHDVDLGQCLLMTSGRISTKMAMKAAKAGVSALAGKGTVTAEALDLAERNGMTLIGYVSEDSAVRFHDAFHTTTV